MRGSRDVVIDRVAARDFWGDGYYVGTSYPTGTTNRNVRFSHCTADNNRRQGLSVVNAHDVVVEGCTFSGTHGTSPEAGIDLEPNFNPATRSVQDIRIIGSHFENNAGYGVLITEGASVTGTVARIVVAANTLIANGQGIVLTSVDATIIADNVVHGSIGAGVHLMTTSNVLVRGNVVTDSGGHGLFVEGATDSSIIANQIAGAGASADNTYAGIFIGGGAAQNNVQLNTIRNGNAVNRMRYGIRLASDATGNFVTNNDLVGVVLSDAGVGTITTAGNRN